MYRILFYEPKKEYHKMFYSFFEEIEKLLNIKTTVLILSNTDDLFQFLESSNNYPDVLYLNDFENLDFSSIDYAVSLRNLEYKGEIVFISKDISHIFDSFRAYPLYFLLEENISKKVFFACFDLAFKKINKQVSDQFFVKIRGKQYSVSYSDILYFKSDKRIITIHKLDNTTLSFYDSFSSISEKMDYKGFLRVHKSYLVNHAYMTFVSKKEIRLVGGISIPVGASYYSKLKNTLLITARNEIMSES